jgi:hypothetical protein
MTFFNDQWSYLMTFLGGGGRGLLWNFKHIFYIVQRNLFLTARLKARSDRAFSQNAKGTTQIVPLAKKLKARFYKFEKKFLFL